MPYIKASTLALAAVSALILAGSAASAADSARGHYITFWGGSQYVMSEAVAEKVRVHNGRAAREKLPANKPARHR